MCNRPGPEVLDTVRGLFLWLLVVNLTATAQTKKVPCYSGEAGSPSCTQQQRLAKAKALANAKSAAVIIEATQGIACGDGSDGCIRTDHGAVAIIEKEVDNSELWQYLTKTEAKKADILLNFTMKDRESLNLCVYEADSNDVLWCDHRYVIALDNDSAREIGHFLQAKRTVQK